MSLIVTLTFSPCIDKSTSVQELLPEKKLKCAPPQLDAGGGGINVSRAIKQLGGETLAIFPTGGYTGKYFNHLLEEAGVPCIPVETKNETRENIIVLDEHNHRQYRFGMPGAPLQETEWQQCLEAVQQVSNAAFIVASGSLPPGVPADIYARLARVARSKNIKLVIDTSGEALEHAVKEGVYLVKPNLGELAALSGKEWLSTGEAANCARELLQCYQGEIIVVSLGSDGALLVTNRETITVKPPKVTPKSTVGAGDSMVAGIVYSLANKRSLKEALQYGVACGTAATVNPGTGLCHKEDADRFFSRITEQV